MILKINSTRGHTGSLLVFTKTGCVSSFTTRSESSHVVVATIIIYLYLQRRPCFALHLQQGWFRSRNFWRDLNQTPSAFDLPQDNILYDAGVFVEKVMK